MWDAKAIANRFLDLAARDDEALTPMKLQKLVYFAHGWYLALKDKPLLSEQVQAWSYGPVIPSLYHEFKVYGNGPITNTARAWDGEEYSEIRLGDPEVKAILSRVWDVYERYTAIQLSKMTHQEGSPWDITWKQCQGRKRTPIPDDLIRDYFKAQLG